MHSISNVQQRFALIEESNEVKLVLLEALATYSKGNLSLSGYDVFLSHMSLGIEKLSKLIIATDEFLNNGELQRNKIKCKYSHKILKMKDFIITLYSNDGCRSKRLDYEFVTSDEMINRILSILQEYLFVGKFDTINILENPNQESIKEQWIELEEEVIRGHDYNLSQQIKSAVILGTIERYIRALVRLPYFDCMNEDSKQLLSPLMTFLYANDSELGVHDYEYILKRENGQLPTPINNISEQDFIKKYGKVYTRQQVTKDEFGEDWPFIFDTAIVECRDSNCAMIVIDNHYFRLNGTAGSRYQLSSPHSAGVAKEGMSIGTFIELAFELWPKADYLKNI
ncbi:hypothetical protein [Desulfovibrio sp. JC010]|uniref:hypothetical protein n=1 Tax=Desulfovibrio sp. JC010 TaxID=2593641 RepID=UPI0013D32FCF|nr:hypothetical protein [Desulfovibrio sp. JC010]NDV27523.1 hypothetical protein [Desulfovibrio sp. JC010]